MFVISNENAKIQIISDIYNIFITKKGERVSKTGCETTMQRKWAMCKNEKSPPRQKHRGGAVTESV